MLLHCRSISYVQAFAATIFTNASSSLWCQVDAILYVGGDGTIYEGLQVPADISFISGTIPLVLLRVYAC